MLSRGRESLSLSPGNGHFRTLGGGISQKFRKFRSSSEVNRPPARRSLRHATHPSLLFAIILVRLAGATAEPRDAKIGVFFPLLSPPFFFFDRGFPSSPFLPPSLSPSSAQPHLLHRKRITFFPSGGDLFPETTHGRTRHRAPMFEKIKASRYGNDQRLNPVAGNYLRLFARNVLALD